MQPQSSDAPVPLYEQIDDLAMRLAEGGKLPAHEQQRLLGALVTLCTPLLWHVYRECHPDIRFPRGSEEIFCSAVGLAVARTREPQRPRFRSVLTNVFHGKCRTIRRDLKQTRQEFLLEFLDRLPFREDHRPPIDRVIANEILDLLKRAVADESPECREILKRWSGGESLAEIAAAMQATREHVRHVQRSNITQIRERLRASYPSLFDDP